MTHTKVKAALLWSWLAAGTAAAGCGELDLDPGDEVPVDIGIDQQEIIGGAVPGDGSLQSLGVVQLTNSNGGCTGTLISNQFVVTARHCVRVWRGAALGWGNAAANNVVLLEGPNGVDQVIPVTSVTENNGNPPDGDFALLQLAQPALLTGRADSLYNPIYTGTDASLLTQNVTCIGYGNNLLATNPPPPGMPQLQQGAGILRTAILVVSSTTPGVLTMTPNATGQVPAAGDSGGTCFFNGATIGVLSSANGNCPDLNGDGTAQSNECLSYTNISYSSPGALRGWVMSRVLADVSMSAFRFTPPVASAVNARLTTINGTSLTASAKSSTALAAAALRAGWIDLAVVTEPARMTCGRTRRVGPMTGSVAVPGNTCLGDGVLSSLLYRNL